MDKLKVLLSIVLLSSLLLPVYVKAAGEFEVISISDPGGFISEGPYYDTARDTVRIAFRGTRVHKAIITSYGDDSTFTTVKQTVTQLSEDYGGEHFLASNLTCNDYYHASYYEADGNLLIEVKVHVIGLVNPVCNSTPDEGSIGKGECDACAILECPAWGDYMGKIDEIIGAIPPPPNWNQVADTFRDSIAPQIKADLQEVIGTAPTPQMPVIPDTPDAPKQPDYPEVSVPELPTPQGQLPQDFEDSGFDFNDIKDQAPKIEEREDPTGGFNIVDPIGSLPSQEEFIGNAPKEGEVPLPDPPKDPENIAPIPNDSTGNAPIPNEEGTPPIPGETGNTAPIPNEEGTAPIPGDDGRFLAPIP